MDTRNNSWLLISVLLFVLGNKPHDSIAANTISLGQSLTGNQTITSTGEIFELGFFKPGESNNYYVGIWYKKISLQTVVWVANRNRPLSLSDVSYSKFELVENGDLVLYHYESFQNKTSIWSTNIASDTSNTTEAVLGDNGNLVLRDGSNPSVVYWQSFDYPTDTWLPGGKLGLNKKTMGTQLLTSWKSQEDPAAGMFNIELDPNGTSQYLIRWNKSVQVWTSGEWNQETKTFTLVPEMRLDDIFNYSYISNENESYFTYNVYNSLSISRVVMDVSGQIKQFTWSHTMEEWILMWSQPKQLCDVYGICGRFGNCNQDTWECECLPGFVKRSPTNQSLQDPIAGCVNNTFSQCGPRDWPRDSTDGCARNTSLRCGSIDWFLPIATSNLPDDPQSPEVNSVEECKSACESTCSCNGYAYTDSECKLWNGDMLNVKQESGGRAGNLYLRRAASEISSPIPIAEVRKGKSKLWKIIIPVITLVATIMGVLGYIYLFKRNKANERGKLKELQRVLDDLLKFRATYNDTPNTNMLKSEEENLELHIFKLSCLATATNNFCLKNKLGEGGFGPVYKGKLQNGQEIAVKRLSKNSGQGIEEFMNEVVLISKLQHRNLVKLLGCCVEGEENMLIYEFMPNKSLDAFLFDPRRKAQLDWEKRFNVIGGIARGILYLHRDSRLRVIHRDLKVSNILLDEDMTPKISDFGMARIFCGNQIIANTSRVVGTFGYMSPEYIMGGAFSEKSDVFSFGVLVLEIVSSKRNNSFYDPEQPLNLLLHTWRLWIEGRWSEVIDEALGDIYSLSEVMKCVHIGLLCVQNRAVDRPTMAEVDFMLISETDRPLPKEPPYSFPALSNEPRFLQIRCSNNNVTFTAVEGR